MVLEVLTVSLKNGIAWEQFWNLVECEKFSSLCSKRAWNGLEMLRKATVEVVLSCLDSSEDALQLHNQFTVFDESREMAKRKRWRCFVIRMAKKIHCILAYVPRRKRFHRYLRVVCFIEVHITAGVGTPAS